MNDPYGHSQIVDHWVVTVLAYMTPYNLHGNFSFRGMGVLVTMGLKIVVLSLLADSRSCLRWSFKQRFPSSLCKSAAIIQREPVVTCAHVTWVRYFTGRVGVVRPLWIYIFIGPLIPRLLCAIIKRSVPLGWNDLKLRPLHGW